MSFLSLVVVGIKVVGVRVGVVEPEVFGAVAEVVGVVGVVGI